MGIAVVPRLGSRIRVEYVKMAMTYVKQLIIINYRSLNYAVKQGCILSGGPYLQMFTNVTS